jgi:hypothetical protein
MSNFNGSLNNSINLKFKKQTEKCFSNISLAKFSYLLSNLIYSSNLTTRYELLNTVDDNFFTLACSFFFLFSTH